MPEHAIFCVIPAERASLSDAILSAGGIPVLDFTCSPTVPVPAGAWVRVNNRRSVPGTGPVILSGNHKSPVRNRETWLELTEVRAVPEGFAGAVVRGNEVGGPCGSTPGMSLLGQMGQDQRVIVDAALSPTDAAAAFAAGAEGVILSEGLWALAEMDLPKTFLERIERIDSGSFHVVNGFQILASPLAPVLRRLLDGEGFWPLAADWLSQADPAKVAWPAGPGVVSAIGLAKDYGTITGVVNAYRDVGGQNVGPAVSRPVSGPSVVPSTSTSDPIAVIGLGCRLPGAMSVPEYWDNLLQGKNSIVEVPESRWDWRLFWDEDKSVPDKTYAKIGGFLKDFKFNSRAFRIPPNVAKQVAIVQQITLESVGEALDDAGYGKDREYDRTRVGVILGNSMGGEVTDDYVVRTRVPAFKETLKGLPAFASLDAQTQEQILTGFEEGVKGSLPVINEDSMPGELSNVIAGRVANAFDLCGPNFTVDAACASSMAAIQSAVKALQSGDIDMCVTGGADRSMGVPTYTKFCKIGALSPNHSAPFDERANGFVMGEGAGIMVLKRLSDARRDGDRVYAVIRGIGASSDGKGKGITAPNPRGQQLALKRAYAEAGVDPVEVDLYECHGTSTVVGDKVEVESLTEVIGAGRRGSRGPIRIGSVKSNIGHLKSAAGAASCIKAALALHNKLYPPSINFENARSDVPFDQVPLKVQTRAEPWPEGPTRRVGVSAFGFGGTNFHVVLEEDRGDLPVQDAPPAEAPLPALRDQALPPTVWGLSAMDRSGLVAALENNATGPFDPSAPVRLAAAAADQETKTAQVERALKVLRKDGAVEMLRGRGIYVEEAPSDGKVAFLFTGQGSQYIDMGLDLAAQYPVVQATFDEANEVMTKELGRPLTDFIRRNPDISEEEQFERLRDTEISQPATLTVDIALMRLLAAHGVMPDMVAGHSLGEYAAAVAAGILSFKDALVAVSARGREMAGVQIDDKGRMAGIAANVDTVQEVLAEIPGYVVPANKNCSTQTVIAGASGPVEAAIEAFVSRGITVYPLPVSHAFHSTIVAPASAPLKKVLERLDVQAPRRPITTNVTSRYYPTGEDARDQIIDILAQQVAAPVEWIAQVERMYADGARIFVECGPKRALSGFVASILKRRPHRAIYTNHPKRGGLASFQDALAALTSLGFDIKARPDTAVPDLFASPPPRLATSETMRKWVATPPSVTAPSAPQATPFILKAVLEVVAEATGYGVEELNLDDELEADLGIDTVKQAEVVAIVRDRFRLDHDSGFRLSAYRTLRDLANYAAQRLGATQPEAIERVLGDTRAVAVRRAPSAVSPAGGGLPSDALAALAEGAARAGLGQADANQFAASILPAVQGLVQTMLAARPVPASPAPPAQPVPARPVPAPPVRAARATVVCAGASVGLPGGAEVFAADNVERILQGEVRIQSLSEDIQDAFLSKNVVRLHKDAKTGQGTFQAVEKRDEVIRLAGIKSHFDLAEQYGVDPSWIRALDITTQLAFAAGIEALRDAQIPLVQTHHTTRKGKKVATGWKLPEEMRASTGVIFASAFPGYDKFAKLIQGNGDLGEGHFDRRFLFQILSMGHSQFAQYIGAQGPNAQANAACASTTQAVAMAADWIQLGRCKRVVVVGADDVTGEGLIEWIGAGFLASGAATTTAEVEEAALPFDARRHGMILGMGAAGLVIEAESETARRGVVPLSRLLASRMANSAFHGSRLAPDHIAGEMDALIAEAVDIAGVSRDEFAQNAMFMSHETYTPAKGGSAAAEIESLRRAFGANASKVVVTNTKGFTGHPMGAGVEDTIVLKALQYGRVPPIPHLKEPDPDLGDLTLSPGGAMPLRFGIRLAAGFGSQLALLAWEGLASGDKRISDTAKHKAWLSAASGHANPEVVVDARHLRVKQAEISAAPAPAPAPVAPAPVAPAPAASAPAASAPAASAPAPSPVASDVDVLSDLLAVISEKTGYGLDELETDYELEADLGIDTVKQAEIFGQVREQYGLAPDENFRLADYPTIETLAGWLQSQLDKGDTGSAVSASDSPSELSESPPAVATPAPEVAPEEAAPKPAGDLPESFRIRRPVWVPRPPWAMGSIKGRTVSVLGDTPLADAIRERVSAKGGSLEGEPDAVIDASEDVFQSFSLAQSLDGTRPKDWITAAHTGAVASELGAGRNAGARAGFAKAIGREWAETNARVVNVDPSMDLKTAAALVIEELGVEDGSVEILWTEEGRQAIELGVVPFPEQGLPTNKEVVVLTGGTRGITAQVAIAFAERGSCKLALLARTPPGESPYDEASAKSEAKAALEEAGERATPAAVRNRLAPLVRAEEARLNVERMRGLGAEVQFFKVDLSDMDGIQRCLDEIRSAFGPIGALVHGAGVEESRLIADKDETAFHRVFDGKAVGGLILADALEPEATLISMGSVAGRFGNPGQVDYSAANEAMAQVCIARPHSLHVDWTAWGDVGMAVRGGMDKLLDARGVEMLPAGPGAQLVVDMVATGMTGEVMVAGKLGDFGISPAHPLIDAVEMDGDSLVARRTLSLASDPWIVDHAIDGKPVLPGVIGLEMMAAVATMADPGHGFMGAEDVQYKAPVKIHGDTTTDVIVTATPVDGGVSCTLQSQRETRTGRIIETEHFSATIRWSVDPTSSLPAMGMPDHSVSQEEIYQRFFHGPAFQVLDKVSAVTADALLCDGRVRHLAIAGGLLTAPLVLEAAFQAAGLHRMMVDGVMALPQAIASVILERTVRDDEPLHLTVRRDGSAYDVDVMSEKGRVMALRGFQMVEAGPLPPNGKFEPPKGGFSQAVIARVKSGAAQDKAAKSMLSDAERAGLAERGTAKRVADRVLGRVAAKQAVAELTGMEPRSFRIENQPSGEPVVRRDGEGPVPHISIAHRDGQAIAVATPTGRAGIDMEVVESRAPSFARTWFRETERHLCSGDPRRESQVWAIKEAVLKVLGTGMRLDPRDVEVLDIAEGHGTVRLWSEAAERHAALGGGELSIDVEDEQSMVIAVAWMAS